MTDLPRVVIHNDQTAAFATRLSEEFPAIDFRECHTYEELQRVLGEFKPDILYTVRFNGSDGFPKNEIFAPGGPKWVSNGGAGTDHFGVWDTGKVTVTNSAGVAADMMAEYLMGGFLHFTLDVPGLQQDQQTRVWQSREVRPLKGSTLLIVGLGSTGRALAARAKAFGMRIVGTRANPRPMEGVDTVVSASELGDLLPEADFIAVCTPLTKETRHLLNEQAFSAMKAGVILGDVSRGHVIEQKALIQALNSGRVAAAVLDVFEEEPLPPDNPLWAVENVLISPHCSSVYEGWEAASFELFLKNLGRWIANKPLTNIVDPQRGY